MAWIKTQDPLCRSFRWQNGYAMFSIGYRHIDYLVKYIDRQQQHHRKHEFKIELVDLLIKHKIDYDECYLWD